MKLQSLGKKYFFIHSERRVSSSEVRLLEDVAIHRFFLVRFCLQLGQLYKEGIFSRHSQCDQDLPAVQVCEFSGFQLHNFSIKVAKSYTYQFQHGQNTSFSINNVYSTLISHDHQR